MKKMALVVLTTAVAAGAAVPAAAQERGSASYKTEASVMYSMLHDFGQTGKAGFLVDIGKQVATVGGMQASVLAEVGVTHFGYWNENYSMVSGALRLGKVVSPRVRPFFQILGGVQHDFGSNGINIQPGAGVNIGVAKKIDAKVQMDFPIVRWEGDTYKQFRFSVGIGIPLGGK